LATLFDYLTGQRPFERPPAVTAMPDSPARAFVRGAQAGAAAYHFAAQRGREAFDETPMSSNFVEPTRGPPTIRFEWKPPQTQTRRAPTRDTGVWSPRRFGTWRVPIILIPGEPDNFPPLLIDWERRVREVRAATDRLLSVARRWSAARARERIPRPAGHRNTEHPADPGTTPRPQPARPEVSPRTRRTVETKPQTAPNYPQPYPQPLPQTKPTTRPRPLEQTRPRTSPANPYAIPGWQPWEMPIPTTFPNPDVWKTPVPRPSNPLTKPFAPDNKARPNPFPGLRPTTGPTQPRLTPFKDPALDFSAKPKAGDCDCTETKTERKREPSCTNKLLSRTEADGIITTRRRRTCP
jgi:hypothetical protein